MGRELLRTLIGLAALATALAGVCALWGWPWAAIVAGGIVGGFYLWGEVRAVQDGRLDSGAVE